MTVSIDDKVFGRISGRGRGSTFSPSEFLDIASRQAVDTALHRLTRKGIIRHLARGLYNFPKVHPVMGELQPNLDTVAKALAGRDATRLQPSGAYAANLLGLSTQVPAKVVYVTDGPSRTVKIGTQQIQLKNASPKTLATAGRISGLVIQAIKFMGPGHVDASTIKALRRRLGVADKKQLMKDIRYAPAWVGAHMRKIAAP